MFFFNDTATTEIYTLSLHDALPIFGVGRSQAGGVSRLRGAVPVVVEHQLGLDGGVVELHGQVHRDRAAVLHRDRKSTRLNSSHANISYAVFCLKNKKNDKLTRTPQV